MIRVRRLGLFVRGGGARSTLAAPSSPGKSCRNPRKTSAGRASITQLNSTSDSGAAYSAKVASYVPTGRGRCANSYTLACFPSTMSGALAKALPGSYTFTQIKN
ncbi:hypothetical protein CCR94_06175 [Rhodoblastus sphagnicola]|uniref:Uncharacterized protein n=1 Tax=Rhodoblastus sphagnicola TaxID=333368 RepID=A0A2S6NC98_9HYPH|nr:hypothetical protein [Rhodoblastus sphagnicola]MBB4196789.1 hypothetical protein [Rhodoblastus sphagnicola]PPQ32236.1 hypothetical protein CCR94_06175 [Rhodoblastus sphagnicola]